MTDPAADAARAAAVILAPKLGANLPIEVEAALAARGGDERPDQYADWASLGTFIVSIATLAWMIYSDLRKHTTEPQPEAIERQVRIKLREQDQVLPQGTEHITEVVVTEITRQGGSGELRA